jgi:hypothetical protein
MSLVPAVRFHNRLHGCPVFAPMFAPAYMGRKRRGAAPPNAPAKRAKNLTKGRILVTHGVNAFDKLVFGPMYAEANMGYPSVAIGRYGNVSRHACFSVQSASLFWAWPQ